MAGTGGFRRGAGRKSNASKLLEAGFVASWFTAEFQEIKWKSFIESEDERIALDAMKYLTDRLYGKAPHSVALNHSGEVDLGLAERMRKARERLERWRDEPRRQRPQQWAGDAVPGEVSGDDTVTDYVTNRP
jgi:hypothetical protein